jgi:hypothetical protein
MKSSLGLWRWERRLARLSVSVVDLIKLRKELLRIKVGDGPWGIAIVPKEGRLGQPSTTKN